MAIRRAGPWASSTDSYLDAPDSFVENPSQSPVNCALVDWVGDTWKTLWRKYADNTYDSGETAAIGEEVTMSTTSGQSDFIEMVFYYQAVNSFDIDLNTSSNPDDGFSTGDKTWQYSTIESGAGDFNLEFTDGDETETITLPASTLGSLSVSIRNGSFAFEGDIAISLSDPDA